MINLLRSLWNAISRPTYCAERFLILHTRYRLILGSNPVPPPIAAIFARLPDANGLTGKQYLQAVRRAITWPDVDALDEALIAILPDADLAGQLSMQRLVYEQMVSKAEYARYALQALDLKSVPVPAGVPDIERLRAELVVVVQRIKYILVYGPLRERARSVLANKTMLSMLFGIALVVALYTAGPRYLGSTFSLSTPLFLVLLCGLVGGFISVQQRLQQPEDVDPLYKCLEYEASGASLLVSPIIGMVFAVILLYIMVGGFVSGDVFPKFDMCTAALAKDCTEHRDFGSFYLTSPTSIGSWAKLAVWSFAAGFLERLVPDILTRIATVAQK